MSDTVIVLQEECILAASGKAGRRPKISRTDMIPTEVHTDPFEQWKRALLAYKAKEHPGSVKLVLPSNYSSARISQIPFATGKQLAKMAEHVVSESAAEGIVDYGITYADKKQGVTVCCASVEENICNRLLTMCEEINLPVRAITVPMEAYLRGLSQLKTYANKTAIFLFFEDSGMTSILYICILQEAVSSASAGRWILGQRLSGTFPVSYSFTQRRRLESRLQTFIMQAVWRMILKYVSMESI